METNQLPRPQFRPEHFPTWWLRTMLRINPALGYPPACLEPFKNIGLEHAQQCLIQQHCGYGEITWSDGSTPAMAFMFRNGLTLGQMARAAEIAGKLGLDEPYFTSPAAYGFEGFEGCVMLVFAPLGWEMSNVFLLESN
jgi:hypothetical protein